MELILLEGFELFKKYGFSEYEAKIYLALLKQHPMNGNNISIKSGVPSAKVYQNLPRLIQKGYIYLVNDGKQKSKKFYVPLPWEKLLALLESSHKQDMRLMKDHLKHIETNVENEWSKLYHIEGYDASIELLQQLIEQTEHSIIFSGWNKELIQIFNEIDNANKRGISIVSILFDETNLNKNIHWKHFQHHKGQFTNARHLGEFVAVFDSKKALILNSETPAHGIISNHAAFVNIAENYIRHDIYINRSLPEFEGMLAEKYGENLEKLIMDF